MTARTLPSELAVIERAVDSMLLLDGAGVCVHANKAAKELLGGTPIGRSFASLLLDASNTSVFARLETSTPDVMVDVDVTVTLDALPRRHLVVMRRRKQPDALSNAVVSALFDGAPCGIVVIGLTQHGPRCLASNRAMERWSLLRSSESGRSIDETCSEQVANAVRDALGECLITLEPHNAEHIFKIDGRETWWLVVSTPVQVERGLTHLVCSFFYIDFLKRTEEDLRRSEQSFRALIERIPDALIVSSRRGVVYASPAALELLGARNSEVIGTSPMTFIHSDDRKRVRASWLAPPSPKLVEARFVRMDGSLRSAELMAIPISFEGTPCVAAIVRDVTERNELQARLVQADRTIALGTLAGGVAHEVNTPLSAVHANVAYLLEQLEPAVGKDMSIDPEHILALKDALQGTDRVARIVRELRALVRGDPRSIGPVDIHETISRVTQLARSDIERRAIFSVNTSDVGSVRGNELLGQAFLNLITNAVHAIPPGNAKAHEVRVEAEIKDDAWVVVRVSDTGTGIPAERKARVFDPFFTTKSPGDGMGLGLPLAQRIVEACGGKITLTSAEKGSTFEVWLARA